MKTFTQKINKNELVYVLKTSLKREFNDIVKRVFLRFAQLMKLWRRIARSLIVCLSCNAMTFAQTEIKVY